MQTIRIHPDFRLQEQSFKDVTDFLFYVKSSLPDSYLFLINLLDKAETLQVLTSGSTGTPKTISISKKAMLKSAEATGTFFELPSNSKVLHCLSSDYIAGKMMWVRALHLGWHIEVIPSDSNPMLQAKSSYDFAAMVPLQAQNSLKELYRIKKLIIGGAPISYSLEQALVKIQTEVYQTYGMTETITHIAVKKLSNHKTYYKSLPNVALSVDNRNCLLIEAPNVSKDLVITNDIVQLISKDEFEWLGRYDNVINSGGVKLFPEQIEKKLAAYINEPFIIASLSDDNLGNKLIILVESTQEPQTIKTQIARAALSKYEKPKAIYYLTNFVRTSNGKINRNDTLKIFHK